MSLSMVTVLANTGETAEFPVGGYQGYQLEDVTGLDPVKAEIASSKFGANDGEVFQSSRRERRNIVLTIGLRPDYMTNDVQSLRQRLSRLMMPKNRVLLKFHDSSGKIVRIEGRVESFEAPLFVRNPVVTVSIVCVAPDFVSEIETVEHGSSVVDLTDMTINYDGTTETGFIFQMPITRAINDLSIVNITADGDSNRIDFAMNMGAGDTLEVSSLFGEKGVWRVREGRRESVLYATAPNMSFPQLSPGPNLFRVQMPGTPIAYSIRYRATYGGL